MAAPADCTAPEALRGRMILLCLPLDKETADAAARVAMGTHRATKIKTNAIVTHATAKRDRHVEASAPA